MADSKLIVFSADSSTAAIDIRTEATNGDGRQVVVFGDPSVNAAVAGVRSQDPGSSATDYGVVARIAGSITIGPSSNAIGTITGITNSISVHLLSTAGTTIVKLDPAGTAFTNAAHTASIFTVSGSSSAVSTSGLTLVAPSSSYAFKVFALQLTTTAQVGLMVRFTNGSGGSPTEFWRYALQAPTQGVAGANLAVTPPGFIFATATNATLALVLDSASLVHYSVSYIKESA